MGTIVTMIVSPTPVVMEVDETRVFTVTAKDKYGQVVPANPTWMITGGIGVASHASGSETSFTATTPGQGTVVAEDGEIVGYAVVEVLPRQLGYDVEVTSAIEPEPVKGLGGSVAATVDDESYGYGIIVTLTAAPDAGWHFLRWEGEVESENSEIDVVVIDRQREPVDPFGGGSSLTWRWPPPPDESVVTYHPEIVAYGNTIPMPKPRTEIGDLLEAKFASRQIRAVFEKEY